MRPFKTIAYITLGSLAVALGALGIFLPLLPTTPFLLLAAYFYVRSSTRLYRWLINHRVFGIYIYSYLTHKAIDVKTKVGMITLLWVSLGFSMWMMKTPWISGLLVLVGVGVTTHLVLLRTLNRAQMLKAREVANEG